MHEDEDVLAVAAREFAICTHSFSVVGRNATEAHWPEYPGKMQ